MRSKKISLTNIQSAGISKWRSSEIFQSSQKMTKKTQKQWNKKQNQISLEFFRGQEQTTNAEVSGCGHTNTATVTVLHKNIYKSTSYLQYTDATVWRKTQVFLQYLTDCVFPCCSEYWDKLRKWVSMILPYMLKISQQIVHKVYNCIKWLQKDQIQNFLAMQIVSCGTDLSKSGKIKWSAKA